MSDDERAAAPSGLPRSRSFILLTLSYSLQGYVGYIFVFCRHPRQRRPTEHTWRAETHVHYATASTASRSRHRRHGGPERTFDAQNQCGGQRQANRRQIRVLRVGTDGDEHARACQAGDRNRAPVVGNPVKQPAA